VIDALWNLHYAVFRPFFPLWLLLLLPDLDAFAFTYFLLLLVSLGVLRRRRGIAGVIIDCSVVGFFILLAYEVCLTLVSPGYLNMHVANVQVNYGLEWFTNLDMLVLSAAAGPLLLLARTKSQRD